MVLLMIGSTKPKRYTHKYTEELANFSISNVDPIPLHWVMRMIEDCHRHNFRRDANSYIILPHRCLTEVSHSFLHKLRLPS